MASWKALTRRGLNVLVGRQPAGAKDAALVAASDLFDREWYAAQYPDVQGSDAASHYVLYGAAEGRDPGPQFSSSAYLKANPDVVQSGINPLVHFLTAGRAEGRPISASGQAGPSTADDIALVAASELFDRSWYLEHNPDIAAAGVEPAEHYVTHGAAEGRDPGPLFSTSWYLSEHKDVADAGTNPLAHFLRDGRTESRSIAPAGTGPRPAGSAVIDDVALVTASDFYNRNWYLAQYPDIADSEVDPAAHYVRQGFREGRDPGPRFSSNWYLQEYRDVALLQVNPLVHYLRVGKAEGRASGPDMAFKPTAVEPPALRSGAAEAAPLRPQGLRKVESSALPKSRVFSAPPVHKAPSDAPIHVEQHTASTVSDLAYLASSSWFDRTWYLAQYPDIVAAGLEPAAHYLEFGAAEGRDPGPRFSTRWYLAEHTDVALTGINPLLHYLRNGKAEGREIAPSPRGTGLTAGPATPPASFALPRRKPPSRVVWHRDLADGLRLAETAIGTAADGAQASQFAAVAATFLRLVQPTGEDAGQPVLRAGSEEAAGASLADIWFANAFDLRLRLTQTGTASGFAVARVYGVEPLSRAFVVAGEAVTGESQTTLIETRLVNPLYPVLFTLSDINGALLSAELLPFPSLCRGGLHYAEACAMGAEDDPLANVRRLSASFAGRLLALGGRREKALLQSIVVDLGAATGIEPIFQPSTLRWLSKVCGIGVTATNPPADQAVAGYLSDAIAQSSAQTDDADPAQPKRTATLPAEAIPTISALVAAAEDGLASTPSPASFLVTDSASRTPRWSVRVPPDKSLLALQPEVASFPYPVTSWAIADAGVGDHQPMAVRFSDTRPRAEASLAMPSAAGRSASSLARRGVKAGDRITVVVSRPVPPIRPLTGLLASLALQTAIDRIDIAFAGSAESLGADSLDLLESTFPGRYRFADQSDEVSPSEAINAAAALSSGRFILLAGRLAALHDPRTVDVLCGLADGDGVASAGCAMIAEFTLTKNRSLEFHSGGIFCDLGNAPESASFRQPNIHAIFGSGTYRVAANSAGLCVIRRDHWQSLNGFDAVGYPGEGADIDYGIRALRAGLHHLCTTVVTAAIESDRAKPSVQIPKVMRALTTDDVARLAGSACSVGELHG